MVNSRLGLFSATTLCSIRMGLHNSGYPLSRSYGYIFAEFLNEGSPAQPLTSPDLFRYWAVALSLEAFLDSVGQQLLLASLLTPHHASGFQCTDLPMHHPTRLHMLFHSHACLPFCVTHCSNNYYRYWNINQLSISSTLSASD